MTCSPQSYCVVDDSTNTARCECNPGFEEYSLGSGGRTGCRDVDECARGIHDCSRMAECVNQVRDSPYFSKHRFNHHRNIYLQEATYACRCLPGYVGDGVECLEEVTCDRMDCDANAECVITRFGAPDCACVAGYEGNGTYCTIVPSDIQVRDSTMFFVKNAAPTTVLSPQQFVEFYTSMQITGRANPTEISFDNAALFDEESDIMLGQRFTHVYRVSNIGLHTVGGLELTITWPLQVL